MLVLAMKPGRQDTIQTSRPASRSTYLQQHKQARILLQLLANKETDRQAERKTDRQTDRQTGRQAYKATGWQTDRMLAYW
jgi:hypothetical protein